MKKIGGNVLGTLQKKVTAKNEIGEDLSSWTDFLYLKGFLDYQTGQVDTQTYSAKIEATSHVFITDYVELPHPVKENDYRLIVNGQAYDVLLVDNPMGLNKHLEFYLQYTGD